MCERRKQRRDARIVAVQQWKAGRGAGDGGGNSAKGGMAAHGRGLWHARRGRRGSSARGEVHEAFGTGKKGDGHDRKEGVRADGEEGAVGTHGEEEWEDDDERRYLLEDWESDNELQRASRKRRRLVSMSL